MLFVRISSLRSAMAIAPAHHYLKQSIEFQWIEFVEELGY